MRQRRKTRTRAIVLALLLGWSAPASAAPTLAKLLDSAGDANDFFGASVALDGSYAIVGAPHDETLGTDAGKAVIYHDAGSGWAEQATLFPSVSPTSALFGQSVAISGDYAVVGSPYVSGGLSEGRVYVFERSNSTWSPHAVLSAPGSSLDDHVGTAVSIDGLHLLFGAPGYDGGQSDSGAAFAYERSGANWNFVNRLDNPHPTQQHSFGRTIDVDLPWTILGALPRSGFLGWTYVFDLPAGSWAFHSNFRPNDAQQAEELGDSLAVSGDQVMVSALRHNHNLSESASFAFEIVGGIWNQTREFIEIPGFSFSLAVGLDGNLAVVGQATSVVPDGGVFAYRRSSSGTWVDVAVVAQPDTFTHLEFGAAISVSNNCSLAGSPRDLENGVDAGAAWVICNFPQIAPFVDFHILCCEQIPDYTTGPVEFEIRWENLGAAPIATQRSVRLASPDGSFQDLVASEQVDLAGGAVLVEPFSIDLAPYLPEGEGAALGEYALILDWTHADGSDLDDIQYFSIVQASPVPGLAWFGVPLLACALVAFGTASHRRREEPSRRARDTPS